MKKIVLLAICCMVFWLLCSDKIFAGTFCVDPGGTGTHTSLQNALNDAKNNEEDDTIKVAQGYYNANFTYGSTKGHSLVLLGGYISGTSCGCRVLDPENTVIDGGGTNRCLCLINYYNGGDFFVEGFRLINGQSSIEGGGLYSSSNSESGTAGNITVSNNIITGSITTGSDPDRDGGGVYVYSQTKWGASGDITFTNNIITGNTATGNAGGIHAYSFSSSTGTVGTITLTNNTITENTADDGGGFLIWVDGNTVNIYNNIIRGNTATLGDDIYFTGGGTIYGYNNNYNGMSGTGWTYQGSNIDADPRFVNTGAGNYHLKSRSPCIDSGLTTAPGIPPDYDFEGDDRIIDGDNDGTATVDMGADEFRPGSIISKILLLLFP